MNPPSVPTNRRDPTRLVAVRRPVRRLAGRASRVILCAAVLGFWLVAPTPTTGDTPLAPVADLQGENGNATEITITDIPPDDAPAGAPGSEPAHNPVYATDPVGTGIPGLDRAAADPSDAGATASDDASEICISDSQPVNLAPNRTARPAPSEPSEYQTPPARRGSVIVVCPPTFLSAMAPWIKYRQSQGYRVVQIDGMLPARSIAKAIKDYAHRCSQAEETQLKAVVIVGDTEPTLQDHPVIRRRTVPHFLVSGSINEEIAGYANIATDHPYGDLDGDHLADVPVGRLSVDTTEQLAQLVRRIIRYEQLPANGNWRRTVHLTAGVGDFGLIADTVIETTARKFLTDGFPPAYRTTMTYGNWRSPYCPDPRVFRETMLRRVHEGCLFWVYMGHGQPFRLDRFEVANSIVPILEPEDLPRFRAARGMPVAILLACYTGAYDLQEDCVAERMLRNPDGPIGVLAASRVTLPYSMTLLGSSLMEGYFEGSASPNSPMTLGDVFLYGKRGLASKKTGGKNRRLIDTLARTLSPTKDELPTERREHQFLFNLFGDPLLEISRPGTIPITCAEQTKSGERLRARVTFPFAGRCQVELVCRRDRLTFSPPRRKSMESHPEQFTQMNTTYARANDPRWFHRTLEVRPGQFYVDVPVPDTASGPSHLRMMLQGSKGMAVGAADVYIQKRSATAQKQGRTTGITR